MKRYKEKSYEMIVRNNTELLIKLKGLKKGEFETTVGVAQGYFAKSKSAMNLSVACKISSFFGISLDDLVSSDFQKKLLRKELEQKKSEIEAQLKELGE